MFKEKHPEYREIIDKVSSLQFIKQIEAKIESDSASLKFAAGSLKSVIISSLLNKSSFPYFIICSDRGKAEDLRHDLSAFVDNKYIAYLVEPKKYTRNIASPHEEHYAWLIDALETIIHQEKYIAISTPGIFELELPSRLQIIDNRLTLAKGESLNFEEFTESLLLNGFEKKDYVSAEGDIAIRGGLVDIYPIGQDNPVRIEFWGNEVDSIREFNPNSQRSIREHDKINFISKLYHKSNTRSDSDIMRYLSDDTVFILDNPEEIVPENEVNYNESISQRKNLLLNPVAKANIEITSKSQPIFNGHIKDLAKWLQISAKKYAQIIIAAEGKIHLQRIKDLIENSLSDNVELELGMDFTPASPAETLEKISWSNMELSEGFVFEEAGIAVFTERQVFNRLRLQDNLKKKSQGITLRELKQLSHGDYVIHEDKGVAQFQGFTTTQMGGSMQDVVKLLFAEGDILYIHMNYIHKIQKYTAQEGVLPKLTRLGTGEWSRKKAKVKGKIKDIARELIKLYAERKMQPGFQFSGDSVWQKEFEASFIYEDTPDQARTTVEVKEDMESSTPMDRLVCGDVGFGKTEIAIRAAFKAVQDGKQVLVLAPTTVLAQQHYMTFKDRLSRYPLTVDVISRFRSPKEQKAIIERSGQGAIDILIGTHRLLSKDLRFKDVGLLVIDEEQRFGVAAKEKLRQMRAAIDTLTLTATPIPRTLNFSLMGARDLSVIETPPRNRLPVYTEILEWNPQIIAQAIHKEIERGGQCFFVNDRIGDLNKIALDLQILLPSARFGVAHGQLSPAELERIMEAFIEGKYDVIVTTKIVESGLDIPNANTIFINRSDNFGLAELYQLRGRVGRTNKQAYCYLLLPSARKISRKALQRLQAIEEFTDLGSGFQLAMRDLEIRGAGNLLGSEQSGFIIELGFELYQKILDEAVQELKRQEFSKFFNEDEKLKSEEFVNEEIAIDIDEDAILPIKYITNDTDRFVFYQKLYKVKNIDSLEKIREELQDRFGKLPKEAENLLFVVKLRISAMATGFSRISLKKNKMVCGFPPSAHESYYKEAFPLIVEYIQSLNNSKLNQSPKKLTWEIHISSKSEAFEILWRIKKTLELLNDE